MKPRVCARRSCRKRLVQPATGRRRIYCSASCRQRAYEERRRGRPDLGVALLADIREMLAEAQREGGPPRPPLRLVK